MLNSAAIYMIEKFMDQKCIPDHPLRSYKMNAVARATALSSYYIGFHKKLVLTKAIFPA
jgi:hypothetical protein